MENRKSADFMAEDEFLAEKYCCFAEASGSIEQYYEKRGVCRVPNAFVVRILGERGIKPVEGERFRYEHDYGEGRVFVKTLFGFENDSQFAETVNNIMKFVENFASFDNFAQYRERADEVIALSKKKDDSLRLLLEQEPYDEILDWAMEFFVGLKEMHNWTGSYNEFPEQAFKEAEYMFRVIKEIGEPWQYEEALYLYNRWRAEVTPFVPLTPQPLRKDG